MKATLSVILAVLAVSCAQFKTAAPLLEPAAACIADQLLVSGATDPLTVVAACAGVTLEDVIAVVEALIAAQPADAGVTEAGQRLAAVHVRALGIRAVK